jgi:hypothetical protein
MSERLSGFVFVRMCAMKTVWENREKPFECEQNMWVGL